MADDRRIHDVCKVNEQGEIICGIVRVVEPLNATAEEAIRAALSSFPSNRITLIIELIGQVANSPLDDACIGTRTVDTVDSVQALLDTTPPAMLLYRYFPLAGDAMAAYYIDKSKYIEMLKVLEHFATTKPAC